VRGKRREPETASITAATHDGRGIAATDGKKVFVAGALPGETVRFVRRKRRRNFDEAELLEVIEASPERIEPRCAVYGRCGGCSLQHMSIEAQRSIKERSLKDNLERIGGVKPERWLPPLAGEEWGYRRRARLAVKDVPAKGRTLVGFRERHAPFITDMQRCEVLANPVDALIAPLGEMIGSLSIRARLPQIEVAVADNAVALVFRVLDPPSASDIDTLSAFAVEQGVQVYLQSKGPDTITPLAPTEPEPLSYALPEFDVHMTFEPADFIQVNGAINQRMVSLAIDLLDVGPGHRVLDLFCGLGNFSLPLARRANDVLGIEGEGALVRRAEENARNNGIDNASFRAVDLAAIDGSEDWLAAGCDRLLLDPARSGAEAVVRRMRLLDPERIVYVSCHPGTLARDAALLVSEAGYVLEAAGIIDMFPHTGHVESIASFSKQN
jgi:23S rRNA (uracil1939-C5)-methyltransferase